MQVLPFIGQPQRHFAFYLSPVGAVGCEAICYLPAYAAELRESYKRHGWVELSQVRGDFSQSGEKALSIGPPSDDTILDMIKTLKSRVKAECADLDAKIAKRRASLATPALMKMDEAVLYSTVLRQLEERRRFLPEMQPTFSEAKSYFLQELRARIGLDIPDQMRRTSDRVSMEQEIGRQIEKVAVAAQEERASVGAPGKKPD